MPTPLFQISTPTALKLSQWALLFLALVPVACIQCSSSRAPNDYEKMAAYVSDHVDLVNYEASFIAAADGTPVPQFRFDIENRGPRPIRFAVVQFDYFNPSKTKVGSHSLTVFIPGMDDAPAIPLPANATWEMGDAQSVKLEVPLTEVEDLVFEAKVGYIGFADEVETTATAEE